ncbi:hypothetical protein B0H16DRAFT_484171 [Mycena metata]|uniref:Uncharacterized protein n=1 Tax=Mycena metata TaxID=1033252 RepID=A0AAD7P0X4_9AGAR|nr:hypothetical protein B0H16DRAFT_484171 [Mycena metata]
MPRKFARTREDIPRHDHSTPNKFQPDRIFQLTLPLDGFSDISTRQLRCMNGFKKADSTDEAVLSVMALELKAHGMDLPIAKAQCMYSAVQGAALSQNANLDMPTLLLSVASGFVHPQVSCWPGKLRNSPPDNSDLAELHAADVCIVDGDSFDLGTMASVVSLFLTVYDTLDMVLRRAYPAADNYDDLETRTITSPADPAVRRRILTPNSLVEWRSRVLPRFQKPSSKRKSEGAESARVKKKSKSDDAEKDEDEADNEDFHGSDTEL